MKTKNLFVLSFLIVVSSCKQSFIEGDAGKLVSLKKQSYDFGDVAIGSRVKKMVWLKNDGDTDLIISSTSGFSNGFNYSNSTFPGSNGTCSTRINKGESCEVEFEFNPTNAGFVSANVSIQYDDGEKIRSFIYTLIGTGTGSTQTFESGETDTTYGANGYAVYDYNNDLDDEVVKAVVIDSNNNIYAVGQANSGALGDENILISRYKSSGILDTSFSSDGKVETDILGNNDDHVHSAVLEPSTSKLAIVGSSGNQNYIARYLTSGSLDVTFGSSASGVNRFSAFANSLLEVATDIEYETADSTYLVSGYSTNSISLDTRGYIAKVDSTGNLYTGVPAFGSAGVATIEFDQSNDSFVNRFTTDSLGNIYAAGYYEDPATGKESAIAKTSNLGVMDVTFGGGTGVTLLSECTGNNDDFVIDIKYDSTSEKIIVLGSCDDGNDIDFFVSRYNLDGTIDSSFNSPHGFQMVDATGLGFDDIAKRISIDSNKSIVISGYYDSVINGDDAFLYRIDSNGLVDSSFGNNGFLNFVLSSEDDRFNDLKVHEGRYVIGGTIYQGSTQDFLTIKVSE